MTVHEKNHYFSWFHRSNYDKFWQIFTFTFWRNLRFWLMSWIILRIITIFRMNPVGNCQIFLIKREKSDKSTDFCRKSTFQWNLSVLPEETKSLSSMKNLQLWQVIFWSPFDKIQGWQIMTNYIDIHIVSMFRIILIN